MLKHNKQRKSKVSQDQVDWLMMELQTMREYNAKNKNSVGTQEKHTGSC